LVARPVGAVSSMDTSWMVNAWVSAFASMPTLVGLEMSVMLPIDRDHLVAASYPP
jgi:hypothetical protein